MANQQQSAKKAASAAWRNLASVKASISMRAAKISAAKKKKKKISKINISERHRKHKQYHE